MKNTVHISDGWVPAIEKAIANGDIQPLPVFWPENTPEVLKDVKLFTLKDSRQFESDLNPKKVK